MLKSKQELNISNLFPRGSVGLEGKMNDEIMIAQTLMVHKLDVLSSWCLADCSVVREEKDGLSRSKYMRESQWRRVNVLSHVDWSFCCQEAKRECALSCCLACPVASQWGSEKRKTGQVCPARKACEEAGERMLPRLFIVAQGSDPGRMAWNILIGRKYEFGTKTVKIFQRQTIIWNSFCNTVIQIINLVC